jgi:hypothetical protein
MKANITGYITYRASRYKGEEVEIDFCGYDPAKYGNTDRVIVREHSFEVEVPDNFDPRPGQIAALDAKIAQERAEFSKRIMELQEQKQRLLAIEMTVDAE